MDALIQVGSGQRKVRQNLFEMSLDRFSTTLIFIHPSSDWIGDVAAVTGQNSDSIGHFRPLRQDCLPVTASHGVDKISVIQQAFGQWLALVGIQIRPPLRRQRC